MRALPPGERVGRCLLGEEVDRVPHGVGIGWWPWTETIRQWRQGTGKPDLLLSREFGFDRSFASPTLEMGIFPHFERVVLSESAETITYRDINGITKRDRRDGGSTPEFLDYPVKTPDDWEQLK